MKLPRGLELLVCILLLQGTSQVSAADRVVCCTPIAVNVSSAYAQDGAPILKVTIRNNGTSAIRLGPGDNPWIGPQMIKAVGMVLPDGRPILNKTRAVIEPSPLSESLLPGQSLDDVVNLDEMYPEIAGEIRRGVAREVMVFWTYRLLGADAASERIGGWVLFTTKSH
jgi:hypothetical protein